MENQSGYNDGVQMTKTEKLLGTITDSRVRTLLNRLHKGASTQDRWHHLEFGRFLPKFLLGKNLPWDRISKSYEKKYLAIDPAQEFFRYLLARSIDLREPVPFSTS
jgi:hypothetical protein